MINVTVKLYSPLIYLVGKRRFEVIVPEESSVREVLNNMPNEFKIELREKYDIKEVENVIKYFIVLLDGKHLSRTENLDMVIKPGSVVEIMEMISGG